MPTVKVIPATRDFHTGIEKTTTRKKRVAAYARVSTDSDDQLSSYEAQCDYYTRYIKSRPDWEFVGLYADEGISGTNTKHRDRFNAMIADALNGKIDLIITKSVSRFARNTVDSLTTVRKLKEKGVEVYFEKENIYTLDSKGELLITIMSSLAQEESRSISENVTWGKRKLFADGKITLPYSSFVGYRKGADGLPEIEPEGAKIVRRIYTEFLNGRTARQIADGLSADGVPTPRRAKKWRCSTIISILTNEKYKGAALLQKSFTVDFLTKKMKPNEGEVPQYYIENSHPAIIEPVEFGLVQAEMQRRRKLGKTYSCSSIFASKIICGDCGEFYGEKVWHSNDPYRKIIFRCNHKYNNEKEKCQTPVISEQQIKETFVVAYNALMTDKTGVIADCRALQHSLTDTTAMEQEISDLSKQLDDSTAELRKHVEENMRLAKNQEQFWKRYNTLEERCNSLSDRLAKLQTCVKERKQRADVISGFMFEIRERDGILDEFDEELWTALLESVTITREGKWLFKFKNERVIEV